MKITARFYSVDDAEFAAAAIRRNGSGIFDITINVPQVRDVTAHLPLWDFFRG